MGHRKAEEAHKEGGNVAVQVLTKCGRVLGVVMHLALVELSILSLPFPTVTGSFSICAPSILM